MCGSIQARSRKEALLKLRRALGFYIGEYSEISIATGERANDYINIYVSPENITLADIEIEP